MEDVLRQAGKPLFPAILWETPQTKATAKKLLIIGGHLGQINDTQLCYATAIRAGIGQAKIILPDKLKSAVGQNEDILYVGSTRSGSIAKSSYPEIAAYIQESDGLLIAGSLSNHPDSASLLEDILQNTRSPIILSEQILSLIGHRLPILKTDESRVLVSSTQGLVKFADYLELPLQIQPQASLINKVSLLKQLRKVSDWQLVLAGDDLLVSSKGKLSLTQLSRTKTIPEISAYMAVFYLQHNQKFAALTAAAWQLRE